MNRSKNTPLISVIIPIYNGEKYVKECLEMVLSQSYSHLEVIAVIDGSTDRSLTIAQQFPVKIIDNVTNKGLAYSRNVGMDAAQGDYIHFLDVDDAINPDFYENMMLALIETGAEVACSGIVNEAKPHRTMLINQRQVLTSTEDKLKATNVGRWGYAVRYLFPKSFLKEHELRFEVGRLIEDMAFSIAAIYFTASLVMVPDCTYTYIHREGSIMTKRDKAHRKKKHQDLRHAKELRHHFARKHKFKIPGVPTGRFSLFFVKWFT